MAVDVSFLRRRTREPLVHRCSHFSFPLIRRSEKCHPAQPTQTSRALRSRSTRSRPEHENNEPALGVAKLVDERTQARGKLKGRRGKQGTVDALCVSQVAKPRKRNRHVGCFATNVSSACRSRSLHTRCPRVNGEGLVDVEDAMTTLFACYSRRGAAASSKFTSNEQNFVRG